MDQKQAKQILTGMETDELTEKNLAVRHCTRGHYITLTPEKGFINGIFTADELEAIATWMRDPSGVVGAE